MTVPSLPPFLPSPARAARGSYLDQLLAEPGHTEPAPEVPAAAEPDPGWASWWDDTWPVEPTPAAAAPAAEQVAPVLPPEPAARPAPEPVDGPGPRPVRRARLPIPTLTRAAPAVPRRTGRAPTGQRNRLPGRGVHVTRRGPAWSTAPGGES